MAHHAHHRESSLGADPAAGRACGGARAGGHPLHAAIEVLALELARLQAELAVYKSLEACAPERVYAAMVGGDYERDGEPGIDAVLAAMRGASDG